MSAKIYFLIGIMIITISTVGFGATLSSPSMHKIGAKDNQPVSKPSVNITNIQFHTQGSNVDYATVTIMNIDSISHTYKICMLAKSGTSISDNIGTTADCTNTASISSGLTGTAQVVFTNSITTNNLNYWNISVHEIT